MSESADFGLVNSKEDLLADVRYFVRKALEADSKEEELRQYKRAILYAESYMITKGTFPGIQHHTHEQIINAYRYEFTP